jgi:hypothetical protein
MAAFEVATSADGTTWVGHHECTTTDASVTFGSISVADEYIKQTYDHLLLVASTRGDKSAYLDYYKLSFNDDSIGGTNYSYTELEAYSGTPVSNRASGQGYIRFDGLVGASALADTFGTTKIWIPNFSQTANFTQASVQWTLPNNSTTTDQWGVGMVAGLRSTTGAITQITIGAGDNFVQYSTFTLYGITGA